MRFIDAVQTRPWLEKYTIAIDQEGHPTFPGSVSVLQSAIPSDSGRKTALSRVIASIFRMDDEALLWINEVGIWPSSEDLFLFQGFRRSLGEDSHLVMKPGHIFSRDDLAGLGSLLAMVFYFAWGAIPYSPVRMLVIRISHDEFMSMLAREGINLVDVVQECRHILA